MALRFCSISSGSSGNCYLIGTDKTLILVDAGISAKRITDSLSSLNISPDELSGIFISHEHSDHIKGVDVLSKKYKIPLYMNEKTAAEVIRLSKYPDLLNISAIRNNEPFQLDDLTVKPVPVSHDAADTVGFAVTGDGSKICTATDTGYMPDAMIREIAEAGLVVLESNHDEGILKMGRYPWRIKQRILSKYGHLSNEAAGNAIVEAMRIDPSRKQFLLAHLSKENNFPEMAYQTVYNILESENLYPGEDLFLGLLKRDEMSGVYEL